MAARAKQNTQPVEPEAADQEATDVAGQAAESASEASVHPPGPRIRNKGLRKVRVADLVADELNPRAHPQGQREGFRGVVEEIGYFGYQDVIELPDGRLKLIDGHLRKDDLLQAYGPDTEIEVNVTDFDPHEARKALATKDHLASMASIDSEILDELLAQVQIESPAMQAVVDDMFAKYIEDESGDPAVTEDGGDGLGGSAAAAVSVKGDIWICGDHRAMCGDPSSESDIALLMAGEQAGLIVSEPPTQKKLSILSGLIALLLPDDAIVVDPWARSGATMIAAESMQKRCFSIDYSPRHVDSAVLSWQLLTGRDAVSEATGRTFNETKAALAGVVAVPDGVA